MPNVQFIPVMVGLRLWRYEEREGNTGVWRGMGTQLPAFPLKQGDIFSFVMKWFCISVLKATGETTTM
jgi:hypothetical protein